MSQASSRPVFAAGEDARATRGGPARPAALPALHYAAKATRSAGAHRPRCGISTVTRASAPP